MINLSLSFWLEFRLKDLKYTRLHSANFMSSSPSSASRAQDMNECEGCDRNQEYRAGWISACMTDTDSAPCYYVTLWTCAPVSVVACVCVTERVHVLLTDACVLCWRGLCSSQFPPGQARPLCLASWDFWEASFLSVDISDETCCTHTQRDGVNGTD